MKNRWQYRVLALVVVAACGSEGAQDSEADVTGASVDGLVIAPECQGIAFDGILHSPGGTVLPNSCEDYHQTTNNPYAVRCIDAWPWYETRFPGDEFCILPPPPELGWQIGMHPQGNTDAWFDAVSQGDMSAYDDPDDPFVMDPGEEEEVNYQGGSNNAEEFNYYRTNVRMRAGSHHMINSVNSPDEPQGVWGEGDPFAGLGSSEDTIPGGQRTDDNWPQTIEKPEEDDGLYSVFPANPGIAFNMHHFNPGDRPILKEAWINMWYEDDARIQVHGITEVPLSQALTLRGIAPEDTADLHFAITASEPVRVLNLFGHRHAWTTNFTAWLEKDGETEIIYQSFDWFDEPSYRYDSRAQNPAPNPDERLDGARTGPLLLEQGDVLHFNCHIEYTEERAALVGAPNTPAEQGNLTFANQAFTAEMCILFGTTAAVTLPAPTSVSGPLPDFATID